MAVTLVLGGLRLRARLGRVTLGADDVALLRVCMYGDHPVHIAAQSMPLIMKLAVLLFMRCSPIEEDSREGETFFPTNEKSQGL